MLPTESIVFLFDGFEHKRWWVYRLLDGGQFSVLLKMDPAVRAQQDVLATPVVPVLGGGSETVAASVALQFLLAVLAVKVIFTGRTQVQELAGRRAGGSVDGGGGGSGLDPTEDGLSAVPAVGSAARSLWSFLPIIVKGDQLPRLLVREQFFPNPEKVLPVLP